MRYESVKSHKMVLLFYNAQLCIIFMYNTYMSLYFLKPTKTRTKVVNKKVSQDCNKIRKSKSKKNHATSQEFAYHSLELLITL